MNTRIGMTRREFEEECESRAQLQVEIVVLTLQRDALRAALLHVTEAYQRHFDYMPVAWQSVDSIVQAALAKVQSSEGGV